jgi:hypothetical protein
MKSHAHFRILGLTLALAALLPSSLRAADNIYTNSASAKWETATNWSLGAPSSTHSIFITNAGSKTVTIDGTTSTNFTGAMTVTNLTIGGPAGATNTLSLTNAGTTFPLHLVNSVPFGTALKLTTGGEISVDGSSLLGENNVGIGNSSDLGVLTINSGIVRFSQDVSLGGNNGQGTITLNGGVLQIDGSIYAGSSGGTGIVNVTGGLMLHTNNNLFIPYTASSLFNLSGGVVKARAASMGGAGGILKITGGWMALSEETAPSSQAHLLIGDALSHNPQSVLVSTNGLLTVTNAAHLGAIDVVAGALTLDGGTIITDNLTLTNGGSFTNKSGTLQFTGAYQVENGTVAIAGGSLQAASSFLAGSASGSTGTVLLASGGTLSVTNGVLGLGNGGALTNGAGTGSLTVSNASLLGATLNLGSTAGGRGTLQIQTNASVALSSNLTVVSSSLSITSSVSVSGGSLTATNGTLSIGSSGNGQMIISAGSVTARDIKLGGVGPGSSGKLTLVPGAFLRFLSSFSSNAGDVGGDVDGNGGNCYIGQDHDAAIYVNGGRITNVGGIFVGYSPGFTGTFEENAGLVQVTNSFVVGDVVVGDCASGAIGLATLNGGALYVTNATHTAVLDVRNGSFTLNNGALLVVDNLVLTNACGSFFNNGGTLIINRQRQLAPFLDTDRDGQSNTNEIRAGTDPLDPNSSFRLLSATIINHRDVRLDWTAVGGHGYAVQRSTNLAGTNFFDLSSVIPVTGTNQTTTNYIHIGAATNPAGYYRIRLAP